MTPPLMTLLERMKLTPLDQIPTDQARDAVQDILDREANKDQDAIVGVARFASSI